ncbi:hypothetical protein CRENBAI_000378 [Crenichthys baileyi]|uniref:Uncharacterized protein n=1 Tax=Crenichthys baileyi TaxID=28760 RepID=A0AAV9S8P5_9TELE
MYGCPARIIKRPLRFIEESYVEDSSSELSTYPTDEESSGDSVLSSDEQNFLQWSQPWQLHLTTREREMQGDALVPSHQSPTTNLTPQAVEIQLPSVQSRDGAFANFAKAATNRQQVARNDSVPIRDKAGMRGWGLVFEAASQASGK